MKKLFARLLCWRFGHVRGKRVSTVGTLATFECRRCDATWTRKDRKKS